MSTTESKVVLLLREANDFLKSGECDDIPKLVADLVQKLQEYHPIVNPPDPVVENPNVVAWRDVIKEGVNQAAIEIQNTLGTRQPPKITTHIRRSVMKDGGVKAKLGIKFESKYQYSRDIDPIRVIQRNINAKMAAAGLPKVAVLTTAGSQMNFSARVYVEGDEDYSMWVRFR